MSAYVIVDLLIRDGSDRAAFESYAEQTNRLLADSGAEVVAFDPQPEVLEGSWRPRTVVVQRYPDMEAVRRFQRSKAYEPLKQLRRSIADTNVIAVEGA